MRQSMVQRLRPGDGVDGARGGTLSGNPLEPAGSFVNPHQDCSSNRSSCNSVGCDGAGGGGSDRPGTGAPGTAGGGSQRRSSLVMALAPWRRRVLGVMNHMYFYWALVFLTFFIIFEDDFKKACLPPTWDLPLEITITVIFPLVAAAPGYFLGFYFWLDAVATSSLVFEVPTVRYRFFGGSAYINLADGGSFINNAGDQLYISSKAGRVARIFRLLRMLRLYTLYTQYVRRRRIRETLEAAGASVVGASSEQLSIIEFEMQQEMERKTRVGRAPGGWVRPELTTRRIIVGVLIMILLIPSFDIRLGTFGTPRTVGESGLRMLHGMVLAGGAGSGAFKAAYEAFEGEVVFNAGTRPTGFLYHVIIANKTYVNISTTPRRFEELYYMSYSSVQCPDDPFWPANLVASGAVFTGPDGCCHWDSFAVYDWRWYSQVQAMLNIARSLFIIALLVSGAYMLNRDSRNLVLLPIERMIQRMQEMAENPLAMAESKLQMQAPWHDKLQQLHDSNGRPMPGPWDSIAAAAGAQCAASARIGGIGGGGDGPLLAAAAAASHADGVATVHLGGGGGSGERLRGGSGNGGKAGSGVMGGVGHHTTITVYDATATAVSGASGGLKRLSVKGSVGGADGQPFLPNKMTIIKALLGLKRDVDLSWAAKREVIAAIADNALASFVLINIAIKKSARLRKYAMRADLNRRMPGFRIAMGFGLHVGWAIEGAIGSEYKIDASYLSPNVNMASRLEAATKQFGVVLLLSEDFVECLSNGLRDKVRQIDCVTVKGSTQPMGLYTYDINLEAIPDPTPEQVEAGDDSAVEELMWRSYACSNEWVENPELAASWGLDWDFKEQFDRGFFAYRVGNWPEARKHLEECRTGLTDPVTGLPRVDGPSDVLLRYMADNGYTAPPGWRGFRELTEK
ncbi:hypothetical protein GPECTOR_22g772 [Gonium pectorale]|uniref:Guanylate cyclase domain-containing protein n=1 Tax=Gonium pectorale TaxID=33097 RepID=A0A150GH61_GONPE|nr:hypothetical protein GPECTOR_22g772 [Gonium pectorale]|eukprot:KXZ49182.1 hypothetical protein GPECTOR_22g772 [Gonium pectorale]